jgi:hypothetical protein
MICTIQSSGAGAGVGGTMSGFSGTSTVQYMRIFLGLTHRALIINRESTAGGRGGKTVASTTCLKFPK